VEVARTDTAEQRGAPPPPDSAERLGADLAALRKASGLTGEGLAGILKISQAKVSKIERGVVKVSIEDTERIAKALGAPEEVVGGLRERAVALRERPAPPRRTVGRATVVPGITIHRRGDGRRIPNQDEVAEREATATRLRNFEVMVVPGLLQIGEYTRQIMNAWFELSFGDSQPYWSDTAKAISVRATRQERIYDTTKTFEFMMTESALSTPLLTPGYMLAQVDRIEAAAKLENVTVRIVPNTAEPSYPPISGFTIVNEDLVLHEVGSTPFFLRDRTEVNFYRRLFEHYAELAVADPGPLLEEYKTRFAAAALPKT
jgi:transcriptional regulator with XRE-family HTH domain